MLALNRMSSHHHYQPVRLKRGTPVVVTANGSVFRDCIGVVKQFVDGDEYIVSLDPDSWHAVRHALRRDRRNRPRSQVSQEGVSPEQRRLMYGPGLLAFDRGELELWAEDDDAP